MGNVLYISKICLVLFIIIFKLSGSIVLLYYQGALKTVRARSNSPLQTSLRKMSFAIHHHYQIISVIIFSIKFQEMSSKGKPV